MTKVLAVIPARGGSKSIPNKNLICIEGKSLLQISIETAFMGSNQKSEYTTDVVVSSDSQKIIDCAKRFGALTVRRPETLSQDSTETMPVIKHTMLFLAPKKYDLVLILQPTSPFRKPCHISSSLDLLNANKHVEGVVSVCAADARYLKSYFVSDGILTPAFSGDLVNKPRQCLPDLFMPNGAIYLFRAKEFLQAEQISDLSAIPIIMDKDESRDIDTFADLDGLNWSQPS